MEKEVFIAIRKDQRTGREWFDLPTTHTELIDCVKIAKEHFGALGTLLQQSNPVVRYAKVQLKEI